MLYDYSKWNCFNFKWQMEVIEKYSLFCILLSKYGNSPKQMNFKSNDLSLLQITEMKQTTFIIYVLLSHTVSCV